MDKKLFDAQTEIKRLEKWIRVVEKKIDSHKNTTRIPVTIRPTIGGLIKMDKIKELVEWVAKGLYVKVTGQLLLANYFGDQPTYEVSWDKLSDTAKAAWIEYAKQILSHPDLYLVDMKKATSIDNQYLGKLWVIAQEYVIPLAEALKEANK